MYIISKSIQMQIKINNFKSKTISKLVFPLPQLLTLFLLISTQSRQPCVSVISEWKLDVCTFFNVKLNYFEWKYFVKFKQNNCSKNGLILCSSPGPVWLCRYSTCVGIPRIVCSPQIVARVHPKLLTSLCR